MAKWGTTERPRKDHIKYVFMYKSKPFNVSISSSARDPKYICAFLTDDNKISFDEFNIVNRKYFARGSVLQFIKKITRRYIDSRTLFYYNFGDQLDFYRKDIMYMLWNLYHLGAKFNMTRVPLGETVNAIIKAFHLKVPRLLDAKAAKLNKTLPRIYEIYDVILENHICPWITDEFNQKLEMMKPKRRRVYKVAVIGLLHMVIRQPIVKSKKKTDNIHED